MWHQPVRQGTVTTCSPLRHKSVGPLTSPAANNVTMKSQETGPAVHDQPMPGSFPAPPNA